MRSNVRQQFQQNIYKCDICFRQYDRSQRQPVIICNLQHTICSQCMNTLRSNPFCPFCKAQVELDKVVFNNYIIERLPADQTTPNVRMQNGNTPYQMGMNYQAPQYLEKNTQLQYQAVNNYGANQQGYPLSDHPLERPYSQDNPSPYPAMNQPAYPPNFNGLPGQNIYPGNNAPQQHPFPHPQAPHNYNSPQSADHSFNSVYLILAFIQLPFAILDLYFGSTELNSQCVEKAPFLQSWFSAMGIVELVLVCGLLLLFILSSWDCIDQSCQHCLLACLVVMAIIKILVWAIAQTILFENYINDNCTGGIHTYGLALAVFHGLLLSVLVCSLFLLLKR